jgi:hypothetical protein
VSSVRGRPARHMTVTMCRVQVFGTLIGSIGGIDASAKAVSEAIKAGTPIAICPGPCAAQHVRGGLRGSDGSVCRLLWPGGIAEMFWGFPRPGCKPNEEYAFLSSRKGFVRMAMKHGVPVVPVYCFGNTHVMHKAKSPWILEALSRWVPHARPAES